MLHSKDERQNFFFKAQLNQCHFDFKRDLKLCLVLKPKRDRDRKRFKPQLKSKFGATGS